MSYRLGVDVGGTFTDLLLTDEATGAVLTAKVPSTPHDPSIAVLAGIDVICQRAKVDPSAITQIMHGTTVATNTLLTRSGARVGLVTTKGHRQILQIARSFVPGGLGGWVVYQKSAPLAPLDLTIEVSERIDARGLVIEDINREALREDLKILASRGIEALTICLLNSYASGKHEVEVRSIAEVIMPGIPISISSEIVPSMREYERTITTVANAYVRPMVQKYVSNLQNQLATKAQDVKLHILRSDGGLASAVAAGKYPVNLLMSGPAGGVSGAIYVAKQSGFANLLTFDMGGTSTDVCLVEKSKAKIRRETTVHDVTVLASSVDVRTVGAGGGSIAHVPELTKALRVGPQSAGAAPGPAAYGKGGRLPTVTDANVVLGYLPNVALLGGDMVLDKAAAETAVKSIADALGVSIHHAAAGIIGIVNENMVGALRLVSVEQGYDPRDFALIAFGGAGPLHANALGILMNSWPVIIPPGPGVLCAYGDVTTRLRDEASRTYIRRLASVEEDDLATQLHALRDQANASLISEGTSSHDIENSYEIDLRYAGQATQLTVPVDITRLENNDFSELISTFENMHQQLYTFRLAVEVELVNLRALAQGKSASIELHPLPTGTEDASAAILTTSMSYGNGHLHPTTLYDRKKLLSGNKVTGPAIVLEMDSTSLILDGYVGTVDLFGSILIQPVTVN